MTDAPKNASKHALPLTGIDREFISRLVPRKAAFLESCYRLREPLHAHERRPRTLLSDVRRFVRLLIDCLVALVFRQVAPRHDVIALDLSGRHGERRRAYLNRFLPGRSVLVVDQASTIPGVRGASAVSALRILAWLPWLILRTRRVRASALNTGYVQTARICILAQSSAHRTRLRTVYIFGLYELASQLVASFLMSAGVRVCLVSHTGPLWPHELRLIGDSHKICTPYQQDELAVHGSDNLVAHTELWGPQDLPTLESAYADHDAPDHHDVIGLYTSGLRLRLELDLADPEVIGPQAEMEEQLLDTMIQYLEAHPRVSIRLFPHPLERGHHRATGRHSYERWSEHPRLQIAFDDCESSVLSFDSVGLGVTTMSTIGFDRLSLGYRTIFFIGHARVVDWNVESPYRQIFCRSRWEFVAAVDATRRMSHKRFFPRYLPGTGEGRFGRFGANP